MFEQLLAQLVAIPSHSGQEVEIAAFVANYVRQYAPSLSLVEQAYGTTGRNVLVSGAKPRLLIDVHLDTVPPAENWGEEAFVLRTNTNHYSALGAVDNKASLSLCLELMTTVDCSALAFSFCGSEETDASGLSYLLSSGALPKSIGQAVVMEPTELDVITAHKGVGMIRAWLTGEAAHASAPEQGRNAIFQAAKWIQALETDFPSLASAHPVLGANTINVGQISGGIATNVVPSQCQVSVDVRTLPGQTANDVVRIFEKIATSHGIQVRLEASGFVPAMQYDGDSMLVKRLLAVTGGRVKPGSFWGHSGLFDEAGIESILFGPGSIEQAHGVGEFVLKKQVEGARTALRGLVESL